MYERAVETSGKGWALMRFQKLANMKDYHDRVRELRDIVEVTERGKKRGRSR